METRLGATLLLESGRWYVQVVHGYRSYNPSYTAALDKGTGKTIWKQLRPAPGAGESKDYRTPQMAVVNGKKELVVFGSGIVTGKDPDTGAELWWIGWFNPTGFPNSRTVSSVLAIGDQVGEEIADGRT